VDQSIYQQLQPHQQQGLTWLWGLYMQQVGGILADEMGLGKTAQICAHCDSIRRSRPAGTQFLIVTPATVLRHWEKEFHRWAPRIRVLLFHPINPTFKVISALGLPGLDRALARYVTKQLLLMKRE
jgi:SNF2 family DNA or RNA helicase